MSKEEVICISYSKAWVVEPNSEPKGLPSLQAKEPKSLPAQLTQASADLSLSEDFTPSRIFVVVSILSGTQQAAPFFENILSPLLSGWGLLPDATIEHTKDARTIIELTEQVFSKNANAGIKQLIILLSGDGGIVDILNSIKAESTEYVAPQISLIPMGTGNALAHSSGITADDTWGLSTLARGSPKALPTFRATFSAGARLLTDEGRKEEQLPLHNSDDLPYMLGAVVCSWGLHAALVADSDTAEYRKFGVERFGMAAREALNPADGSGPHRYRAGLSLMSKGTEQWIPLDRSEHAYVLTTLVSSLEKGFTISPHSSPLEGTMRIVHFGPMLGDEVMELMNKAYQGGKHIEENTVSYKEVDGVRIDFDDLENDGRWRRICLDGKIIRVESNGWVEIRREESSLLTLRHLQR